MDKRSGTTLVLIFIILVVLIQGGVIIWAIFREGMHWLFKGLVIAVPLVLIIWLISVYRERMKEIGEDERDHLDQY